MDEGGKFRIRGYVSRKFIPSSGKCAFVTVEYLNDRGKKTLQDMIAFSDELIARVRTLGEGEQIDARGDLARESIKDKARKDVIVDGKPVWVTKLRLLAFDVTPRKAAPPLEDVPPPERAPLPGDEPEDEQPQGGGW